MIVATLVFAVAQQPTFSDIVSSRLNDVSFSMAIESSKRSELIKINKDFAMSYEAESGNVIYAEPMQLRLSTVYNGQEAVYIIKGDNKSWRIPRLKISGNENVADKPGKRQTMLDFGIITKWMAEKFLNASYIRTDRDGALIFDLTYQFKGDKSRHRVWVHPDRKYIMKRMWYNQHGQLMATFEYTEPTQVNNVWFPTKLTVSNAEGKVAGVTRYRNIKINSGVPASTFNF